MKKIIFIFFMILLIVLTGCTNNSVYVVEFIVDDVVVDTQEVMHGNAAVTPPDPIKEGYIFNGWDKKIKNIKENLKVTALFEKKEFNVIFYDEDGNILKNQKVKYQESATAPVVPEKTGFVFSNWDVDFTSVTSDLDIYPVYNTVKYTVVFKDDEGNIIKETQVEHGKNAINPANPKKHGYTFVGWDKEFKNVTSNLEVTAKFELTEYTITYIVDGEKINLEPSKYTILSDASIDLPNLIEKEGFECIGWFEGNTRVVTFFSADAENKVYTLQYKELEKPLELPNDYTFLFTAIKKGTTYQPDFTGLNVPNTSVLSWEWSSLHPEVINISIWSSISVASSGFGIIKAVYKDDPSIIGYAVVKATPDGVYISSIEEANAKVEYEVTFTDDEGNIIETQTVIGGKNATLPTPPEKEGYTFVGWSAPHYNIEENITIEANYIEGTSDFIGKKVSILGDSITTFNGYIPDGYKYFYPYPTADFGDVNQTWWMQVINNLGMTLLKNNSYSGSCVSSGTGSSAAVNDARLKELLFGTETPDVILIFMGANDCGSQYVSLTTFTSSYKIMIEKIQALCPNAEICLLTLPTLKMYTETDKEAYNEVIRKYASDFELTLIEMKDTFTVDNCGDYLVDSAHPNKAGMIKFSEEVIKGLLASKGIVLE